VRSEPEGRGGQAKRNTSGGQGSDMGVGEGVLNDHGSQEWSPGATDLLRYRLARWRLKLSRTGREMTRFSQWLESELLPEVFKRGETNVTVTLESDGRASYRAGRRTVTANQIEDYPYLFTFLRSLGIRTVELDPRLESNQLSDLFILLYSLRQTLCRRSQRPPARGIAAVLVGTDGLQFACTRTQVTGDRLSVEYSYCTTRLSRFVRWVTRRNRQFNDHRTLFNAAPRYGLIAALLAFLGPLALILSDHRLLMVGVTLLAAGGIYALVYLFFMTVGSLEYDNEEKNYRLARAYEEVNRYAIRVQDDLRRAKAVQDKIIPKVEQMPFADHLEWAASFEPQSEVGGDYFDAAALDARRVAILFSDVSGHGLAAAMVTALLKISFETWVTERWSLQDFTGRLNHQLCSLTPDESFAAAFLCIYDVPSGGLTYVNCGHGPVPRLVSANGDGTGSVANLSEGRTMPLGIMERRDYAPASVTLRRGDTLTFITDGIPEAEGGDGDRYGEERMDRRLAAGRTAPPAELIRDLMVDLRGFVDEVAQEDDLTVLAMRIRNIPDQREA
jgi:sigma-B regulation protein RsbU (phosphoserine phosphatase)